MQMQTDLDHAPHARVVGRIAEVQLSPRPNLSYLYVDVGSAQLIQFIAPSHLCLASEDRVVVGQLTPPNEGPNACVGSSPGVAQKFCLCTNAQMKAPGKGDLPYLASAEIPIGSLLYSHADKPITRNTEMLVLSADLITKTSY